MNRSKAPAWLLIHWQSSSRAGLGRARAGVTGAGPGRGHWGPRAMPAALILFQCILVPFLNVRILSQTQLSLGSFSAVAAGPQPTALGRQAAELTPSVTLPSCSPAAPTTPSEHSRQAHGLQGGHQGSNARQGPQNLPLPGLGAPSSPPFPPSCQPPRGLPLAPRGPHLPMPELTSPLPWSPEALH